MNRMDPQARQARAAARRGSIVAQVYRDGHAPPARLSTALERLSAMGQLAADAWALSGRELPSYTRDSMPGRVIRP